MLFCFLDNEECGSPCGFNPNQSSEGVLDDDNINGDLKREVCAVNSSVRLLIFTGCWNESPLLLACILFQIQYQAMFFISIWHAYPEMFHVNILSYT